MFGGTFAKHTLSVPSAVEPRYKNYLPFLFTTIIYCSYLPFLFTILIYNSYLRFLFTILIYHSYLRLLFITLIYHLKMRFLLQPVARLLLFFWPLVLTGVVGNFLLPAVL